MNIKNHVHAVIGLIDDSYSPQKILASKRQSHQSYAGYWEFPGGKIEPNEDSQSAIVRELHEELGIAITKCHFLGTIDHEYSDHIVKFEVYKINKYVGKIHGREGQQLTWIEFDNINNLEPLLEASFKILDLIS